MFLYLTAHQPLINVLPPGFDPVLVDFFIVERRLRESDKFYYNFLNVADKRFESLCTHGVHRVAYPHPGHHSPHSA